MTDNVVHNYRVASPRRKKLFLVLVLFSVLTVAAAFTLQGKIPIRVVEPFQITRETALVTLYPGTNATQFFQLENFLAQPLSVTVMATGSDPGIILWQTWPQSFTLDPNEVRIITVELGASDTLPAGPYQIDYTATWVPS